MRIYYSLGPLLAAIGNLVLAVVVFRRDPRSELNRTFAFGTVTLVLWNLNIFVFAAFKDAAEALYWSRIFRVGTLLMPVAVTHFFFVFSARSRPWVFRFLVSAYAVAAVLTVANSADLLVSGLRRYPSGFYYVGTPLYQAFTLLAFACAGVTFYLLISEYRSSPSPRRRLQSKLWLLGTSIALPFGLTNLLIQPGTLFPPLGNLANTVYVGIVAYGILRHRLMDIDVVITKGMAYATVGFALIAPAFIAVLWLQRLSFGRVRADFSLAILLLLIAVGVLFPALRLRAESRIERSLFREKYGSRAALSAFTHSIVRILDRERLLRELADTLMQVLRLDRVAIFLQGPEQAYRLQHSVGVRPTTEEFLKDDVLVRSLAQHAETVLREELDAGAAPSEQATLRDLYRVNGWEVSMPLTISGKLIGFVNLGRKGNLEVFSWGDLELLKTLAAETAIALENARLYDELKKSQDIIRRADRLSALGTLAAGIAHEVRNPLVSIQTFFQLAPQRLHDEEFFTTFLGMTASEVKRISDLVTELLSFARSATPSLGPVGLNELVERVATLLEPEARKYKLTLTRVLSPDVQPIKADGDQIKQVLINLVLNAIQATRPGGVVAISTRCVDHQDGAFAQLEIRDTGAGIPPEHLEEIFNPFFTTKAKGTGLGLSIAHQIVTEHGGSITVESREGQGTTVLVNLPAYVEEAVSALAGQSVAAVESAPLGYALRRKVAS